MATPHRLRHHAGTLGDRQVEVLGEGDEELAARARAARLDEAEVLGGELRVQRQLHDGHRAGRIGATSSDVTKSDRYIAGNRRAAGASGSFVTSNASQEATEMNAATAPPETRTRQAEQLADRYPMARSVRTSGGVLATAEA
jgi:hypothetical protein